MKQEAQKKVGSPTSIKKEMRRPLTQKSLERMKLPRLFWTTEVALIEEGPHKKAILRYLSKIDQALGKGFGMVLWGDNDSGKTSAASLCLKEARRRGYSAMFITAAQYIAAYMNKTVFDDAHSVEQRCKFVDLLVIDDLGKEVVRMEDATVGSVAIARVIDDLVRSRCTSVKPTIITANLDPKTVGERYGRSFVRLLGKYFSAVEMTGASQREKAKNKLTIFFEGEEV